jgi:tetratricopeptide (TPR) repeat protein
MSLAPLEPEELDRLLRSQGMESAALRRKLVEDCMGNPGLLHAVVSGFPREIDVSIREAGEDLLEEQYSDSPPPQACVRWAERKLREIGDPCSDLLLLLALDPDPQPWAELERRASCQGGPARLSRSLPGALLLEDERGARFRSLLWARSFEAARRGRAAELARRRLREPALLRPENAVSAGRLALRFEEWDALDTFLEPALSRLHEEGRFEEELRLFAQACDARPAGSFSPPESMMRRLASTVVALGARAGQLLPRSLPALAQEQPDSGSRRCLLAWAQLGEGNPAGASEALSIEAGDPSLEFLLARIRFRALVLSKDFSGAHRQLMTGIPGDESAPAIARVWRNAGRAELLLLEARYDEAAALLDQGRPWLPELAPGERASYLQLCAVVALRQGELRRAREDFIRAEAIWREYGFRANRLTTLGSLGAIEYQEGDLPRAQVWNEELLREWIRLRRWDSAVTAVVNLSLILLDRGRLGEALQGVRDGRKLAAGASSERVTLQIGTQEAFAQMRVGLLRRARERAAQLLAGAIDADPSYGPFLRTTLGEILAAEGLFEEARAEFRGAVDAFVGSGAGDDAAEALLLWALHECGRGEFDRAARVRQEIEPLLEDASGLTRGLLLLVDGELEMAGRETGGPVAARLENAVRELERQERWYFAWRARWRLATVEMSEGRPRDAARDYGAARARLHSLAGSLRSDSLAARFLALPAPRAFLAEIQDA